MGAGHKLQEARQCLVRAGTYNPRADVPFPAACAGETLLSTYLIVGTVMTLNSGVADEVWLFLLGGGRW